MAGLILTQGYELLVGALTEEDRARLRSAHFAPHLPHRKAFPRVACPTNTVGVWPEDGNYAVRLAVPAEGHVATDTAHCCLFALLVLHDPSWRRAQVVEGHEGGDPLLGGGMDREAIATWLRDRRGLVGDGDPLGDEVLDRLYELTDEFDGLCERGVDPNAWVAELLGGAAATAGG